MKTLLADVVLARAFGVGGVGNSVSSQFAVKPKLKPTPEPALNPPSERGSERGSEWPIPLMDLSKDAFFIYHVNPSNFSCVSYSWMGGLPRWLVGFPGRENLCD